MTKSMIAAILALALVATHPVSAAAENAAKAPKHSGGIVFSDPSFIGLKVARLRQTTTATELVTGQGLLYAICPEGGTLGKYTVAFDYTLSEGDNFPSNPFTTKLQDGGEPSKYMITPTVPTRIISTQWGASGEPYASSACFVPPWPVRFSLALIGAADNAGHNTLFYYRLDDGTNP